MKIKISDKVKSHVKFQTKLLVAVALLALLEFYLVNNLISWASSQVVNAYTGQYFR